LGDTRDALRQVVERGATGVDQLEYRAHQPALAISGSLATISGRPAPTSAAADQRKRSPLPSSRQ